MKEIHASTTGHVDRTVDVYQHHKEQLSVNVTQDLLDLDATSVIFAPQTHVLTMDVVRSKETTLCVHVQQDFQVNDVKPQIHAIQTHAEMVYVHHWEVLLDALVFHHIQAQHAANKIHVYQIHAKIMDNV